MTIATKMAAAMQSSSWIRRMFEEGAELKARLGAANVFDFTLGNPDLEPPAAFKEALLAAVQDPRPGLHGYMPNAGLPATRQAVAAHLRAVHGLPFTADEIIMTCGAAGALNIILKAVLDPWDEVLVLAPFFPEYLFYVENHGGVVRVVETDQDFLPVIPHLEAAINDHTRAVIINSPNNPTGQVYGAELLHSLGEMLAVQSRRYGRPIYLINDEPYRRLVYDQLEVPSVFQVYPDAVVATSFSKDLSLPGERLGYVAVSPRLQARQELVAALVLANRILGFVNAPALMQRAILQLLDTSVDITPYERRRELFCRILGESGYQFVRPKGAFYLFPQAPVADDVAFVQALKEENILAVPGRGFGRPGYFRLAFCVPESTIVAAAPGFARVMTRLRG
ncbi:MAG: pyridoxal phosphate-dependent aminotransferase [Desulfobacca sp.]|uniref:pyridoxal phosphate-dependent aminotransferase n=1 Tax=Desulfobacca sp. TaxID=2067990 RepID=UPI00404A2325